MKIASHIRKILALFAILALFVETFHNGLIWADYLMDTQQYAALCVNTDKPEMNCHGQCQMVEKMNQADQDNQQNGQVQAKTIDIILYFEKGIFEPSIPVTKKINHYPGLLVPDIKDFSESILHPPIAA